MKRVKEKAKVLSGIGWLNWTAIAIAVFVLPFLYLILVEFIRMQSVTATLAYVGNHLGRMALAYVALLLFTMFVCVATARPWVANFISGGLMLAMGFANYYKLQYRGDPLVPKDIVQVGEAAEIAGELSTPFTREIWVFLAVVLLTSLLLLPFRLPFKKGAKSLVARVLVSVLCLGMLPVYVIGYMGNKERMAEHGVVMKPASLAESYYVDSFLTGFLYLVANMWQAAPQGYSEDALRQLAQQVPQSDAKQTDVIVVLLESFYDIEKINGIEYSEPLMPNYHRLTQEGVSGEMLEDKRGGGTSDYEFSVLTGFATGMLPVGSVPYIEYIYDEYPGLPQYYGNKGYNTIALHPYQDSFYNRRVAYPQMGFDTFLTEKDFGAGDVLGDYVSDEALARRMISEYENLTAQGEHVFMHVVTMQNHTPYAAGRYSEEHTVQARAEGKSDDYNAALSALATGIRDEDRMIGMLTDYFSEVERDVVVLFFGDHQTGIVLDFEKDAELVQETQEYQQADEAGRFSMTHTTPYLIWSNFSQKKVDGGLVAPYMLAPLMMEHFDIDGPDWFLWLAATRGTLGGTIGGWVINPDGTIGNEATPQQQEILDQQELFQYDIMFGKKYAYDVMYS